MCDDDDDDDDESSESSFFINCGVLEAVLVKKRKLAKKNTNTTSLLFNA
jgi:hypothetical protein